MAKRGKYKRGRHIRRTNYREVRQRFLIVCEGEVTEPEYFKRFRTPKCVISVEGLGKNPVRLVEETLKRMKGEYDQVWCVFDKDENSDNEVNRACTLAQKNGIGIALSNQAFELWFLLHFQFIDTAQDRKALNRILLKHLPNYEKTDSEVYNKILHLQKQAVSNAKNLLASYTSYDENRANPSTTVHMLVAELNKHSAD